MTRAGTHEVLRTTGELLKVMAAMPRLPKVGPGDTVTIASLLDRQARRQPDAVMVVTRDGETTWRSCRERSNRVANALRARGIGKGDVVGVLMENSPDMLAIVIGITRIGAIASLINTNLAGGQLVQCLRDSRACATFVDEPGLQTVLECEDPYREALGCEVPVWRFGGAAVKPEGTSLRLLDGAALLAGASPEAPVLPEPVRSGDAALYIFTSGTTGLPKPAITTHGKFVTAAGSMARIAFRARRQDRLYLALPLYHGAGMTLAVGTCLYTGCSLFLRRKFSAARCIEEVRRYHCTLLIYVGEICRYLLQTPERPDDSQCGLRTAVGNGLRPDIWKAFRQRFGLTRIAEFYAASESNGGFTNVLDKDCTIGMTGNAIKLVRCADDAAVLRDDDGRVLEVPEGEAGLLLMQVRKQNPFDGYVRAEDSERKLVRDAVTPGDCWFNTGDLVRRVDVGFAFGIPHYQFVDRLGDTFRWKAENVSTVQVSDTLCAFDQIAMAAVYGVPVPGHDGKAGMAAVVLAPGAGELDLGRLAGHLRERLPEYARPLFLRIVNDLQFTGTHKIVKSWLVAEGYDPSAVGDPLFMLDAESGGYRPLRLDDYRELTRTRRRTGSAA